MSECPGLLSGASGDGSGGLLRQLGPNGVLLIKDLTSLLSEHAETRPQLFAALREVYDGTYVRHLGANGGASLAWRGKATVVAGVTEAIEQHAETLGSMGERFMYLRLGRPDSIEVGKRVLAAGDRGPAAPRLRGRGDRSLRAARPAGRRGALRVARAGLPGSAHRLHHAGADTDRA